MSSSECLLTNALDRNGFAVVQLTYDSPDPLDMIQAVIETENSIDLRTLSRGIDQMVTLGKVDPAKTAKQNRGLEGTLTMKNCRSQLFLQASREWIPSLCNTTEWGGVSSTAA